MAHPRPTRDSANRHPCRQAAFFLNKKCCLLVLNSVTSPPRWIRQPQLRAMHGVCVFFFGGLASCGYLRPCLFRHLSFLTSPYAIQTYSRRHLSPYSLLHSSTSAPPRPLGTSVLPPPSTQASTIHLCDNLSTDKLNK
jgi:hypothetical protein